MPYDKMSGRLRNFVGYAGEIIVILLLKIRFQKILFHRYKTPVGEVDIISQKGNSITFIEVKTSLARRFYGIPISYRQQKTIVTTAKYFLSKHPQYANFQISFEFYFVSITKGIITIRNAWDEAD